MLYNSDGGLSYCMLHDREGGPKQGRAGVV